MALGCIGAKLDTVQKLSDLIESIMQRLPMGNELDAVQKLSYYY